jgi:DNA-binding XRE family transcriptional regulator
MNKRIEEVRKHLGETRASFGKAIGVSGDVINNLERGRVEIKEHMILLICEKFRVNEKWLKTGEGEMFVPKTREDTISDLTLELLKDEPDSFRNRVVSALAKMSVEEWKVLEKVFDDIVK